MTTIVLPWRHASELAFVRDCFYPHHATSTSNSDIYAAPDLISTLTSSISTSSTSHSHSPSYKAGLHRVAVWNFRSPKSVPHAVAATAMLIEARYYDEIARRRDESGDMIAEERLSESAISSLYSMAFIRFVNGFVDRDVSRSTHRTGLSKTTSSSSNIASNDPGTEDDEVIGTHVKGTGESSMYAHAATIGMPTQFVDLRHRCVHGSGMVEGWELRRMCGRALEWLWVRWWVGNAEGDRGRWIWEVEMAEKEREEEEGDGAGEDAGKDAGEDAGKDAGEDAGKDAGEDAGEDGEVDLRDGSEKKGFVADEKMEVE